MLIVGGVMWFFGWHIPNFAEVKQDTAVATSQPIEIPINLTKEQVDKNYKSMGNFDGTLQVDCNYICVQKNDNFANPPINYKATRYYYNPENYVVCVCERY
jgi:hypothetical protein